jgi:hypothetical protein
MDVLLGPCVRADLAGLLEDVRAWAEGGVRRDLPRIIRAGAVRQVGLS